jgi:phosphoribosyl 1,2-cyclic phosphodiesterase
MRIKFWGVRGSTPTPERRNSGYGGNTTCLEIRLENGTILILDCGSGLRGLGNSLTREFGEQSLHAYIFLTHFHWDHIQGIPFFVPLYRKENSFFFHAVNRQETELKAIIEGQLTSPYFPVDVSILRSTKHFYDLGFEPIEINGAVIRPAPLFHPQGCVAYRVEGDGGVFVLATDTEPGSPVHDRSLRELARDADVLVYDAQYTPEQLAVEKKGWGHSSWLEGTRIAKESNIKHLVLFHHDPDHEDAFVDGLVENARQEFKNTIGAAEGVEIRLSGSETKIVDVGISAREALR